MIALKISPTSEPLQIVEFELPEPIEPRELASVVLPDALDPKRPVSFSGRGPVWLFAHLTHLAHPFVAVCVFDPRIGHIVVESHSKNYRVGQVIDASLQG